MFGVSMVSEKERKVCVLCVNSAVMASRAVRFPREHVRGGFVSTLGYIFPRFGREKSVFVDSY